MFQLVIPSSEFFNDATNEFVKIPETILHLEHSLVSVSKWESIYKRPFLSEKGRTKKETIDYIRCMTITQNVKLEVYSRITDKQLEEVCDYINDSMTATWFNEKDEKKSGRVITSELLYCWMFTLGIPIECQKWHLNRLLTLIKVCNIENSPKKKRSKQEQASYNRSLNAARKAKTGTHG